MMLYAFPPPHRGPIMQGHNTHQANNSSMQVSMQFPSPHFPQQQQQVWGQHQGYRHGVRQMSPPGRMSPGGQHMMNNHSQSPGSPISVQGHSHLSPMAGMHPYQQHQWPGHSPQQRPTHSPPASPVEDSRPTRELFASLHPFQLPCALFRPSIIMVFE